MYIIYIYIYIFIYLFMYLFIYLIYSIYIPYIRCLIIIFPIKRYWNNIAFRCKSSIFSVPPEPPHSARQAPSRRERRRSRSTAPGGMAVFRRWETKIWCPGMPQCDCRAREPWGRQKKLETRNRAKYIRKMEQTRKVLCLHIFGRSSGATRFPSAKSTCLQLFRG